VPLEAPSPQHVEGAGPPEEPEDVPSQEDDVASGRPPAFAAATYWRNLRLRMEARVAPASIPPFSKRDEAPAASGQMSGATASESPIDRDQLIAYARVLTREIYQLTLRRLERGHGDVEVEVDHAGRAIERF